MYCDDLCAWNPAVTDKPTRVYFWISFLQSYSVRTRCLLWHYYRWKWIRRYLLRCYKSLYIHTPSLSIKQYYIILYINTLYLIPLIHFSNVSHLILQLFNQVKNSTENILNRYFYGNRENAVLHEYEQLFSLHFDTKTSFKNN